MNNIHIFIEWTIITSWCIPPQKKNAEQITYSLSRKLLKSQFLVLQYHFLFLGSYSHSTWKFERNIDHCLEVKFIISSPKDVDPKAIFKKMVQSEE